MFLLKYDIFNGYKIMGLDVKSLFVDHGQNMFTHVLAQEHYGMTWEKILKN